MVPSARPPSRRRNAAAANSTTPKRARSNRGARLACAWVQSTDVSVAPPHLGSKRFCTWRRAEEAISRGLPPGRPPPPPPRLLPEGWRVVESRRTTGVKVGALDRVWVAPSHLGSKRFYTWRRAEAAMSGDATKAKAAVGGGRPRAALRPLPAAGRRRPNSSSAQSACSWTRCVPPASAPVIARSTRTRDRGAHARSRGIDDRRRPRHPRVKLRVEETARSAKKPRLSSPLAWQRRARTGCRPSR